MAGSLNPGPSAAPKVRKTLNWFDAAKAAPAAPANFKNSRLVNMQFPPNGLFDFQLIDKTNHLLVSRYFSQSHCAVPVRYFPPFSRAYSATGITVPANIWTRHYKIMRDRKCNLSNLADILQCHWSQKIVTKVTHGGFYT
jgi:hypothetical protein